MTRQMAPSHAGAYCPFCGSNLPVAAPEFTQKVVSDNDLMKGG